MYVRIRGLLDTTFTPAQQVDDEIVFTATQSTHEFYLVLQDGTYYYLSNLQITADCPTLEPMQAYRYKYNGKELLPRFGGQYDYGFRMYKAGLGRFLSVDPLTKKYPELTPYQFGSNRPIDGIDLDGLEYSPFHVLRSEIAKAKVAAHQQLQKTVNAIKSVGRYANSVYSSPTTQGAIGIGGGVASMVGGAALLLTPEPTGGTKVAGVYGVVQGYAGVALGFAAIVDAQDNNSTRKIEGGLISQMATSVDPNNENGILIKSVALETVLGLATGRVNPKVPGPIRVPSEIKAASSTSDANSLVQLGLKYKQYRDNKSKSHKRQIKKQNGG